MTQSAFCLASEKLLAKPRRFERFAGLCFVMLLALNFGLTSPALCDQASQSEAAAKEIFFEVMSPFCPGRSLHDCPSGAATDLKNEIRASLQRGENKNQIMESLVQKFGSDIRAVPSTSGFGLLAWLVPGIFLIGGGLIIVRWIRSNSSTPTASPLPPLDPEMQRRLTDAVEQSER